MTATDTARRHSHYLARQLDNGRLKPEILQPLVAKVLQNEDFMQFADWQAFRRPLTKRHWHAHCANCAVM